MDKYSFDRLILPLTDAFGDKFAARRAELLFDGVKTLSADDFDSVVNRVLRTFKFAPTIDEVISLCRPFQGAKELIECTSCNSSGQMVVYERSTGVTYCFACTCDNGRQYAAFPKWRDALQKDFTRQAPMRLSMNGKENPYEGFRELKEKLLNSRTPKTYTPKKIK